MTLQKYALVISCLLFANQLVICQTPTLVEDYILGSDGSVDGTLYNFGEKLTYEGTTQFGENAILQYDKNTEDITVLATDDDFDGEIISIFTNSDEILIVTGEGSSIKNYYRSYENDLSDLELIYNSGDATLKRFRFHEGYSVMLEENTDGTDITLNIKLHDLEGLISDILVDLPGRASDYSSVIAKGHLILAPEVDLIDGKSMLAFNLETKSFVPITNIIPEYEDCGLISSMNNFIEDIINYSCDDEYFYDINSNEYLDIDSGSLVYTNEDYLYISGLGNLHRIDKITGEQEIIISDVFTSTRQTPNYIALSTKFGQVEISYFNFEEEKLYTYPTILMPEVSYRIVGFGVVPSGVHIMVFENQTADGVISRINSESYITLGAVNNVSFNTRTVGYGQNIFFTHEHPDYGYELFVIDYSTLSTNETDKTSPLKISPNPARNYINVEHNSNLTPSSTSIIDMRGNTVMNQISNNKIEVSHLSSGIYIVKTIYENGKIGIQQFVLN